MINVGQVKFKKLQSVVPLKRIAKTAVIRCDTCDQLMLNEKSVLKSAEKQN